MQQQGLQVPQGAEIDPAGNANENEGFGKQLKKWGPIVGGAALTAFGIPGVMPGLLGLGGAAAPGIPALGNVNSITSALGGGGGGLSGALSGIGKTLGGDLAQRFMGAAGSGLAGASQASANNRGVALDAAMEQERLRQDQTNSYQDQLLRRSVDDRASLTDAFTKSVQANRVANTTGYTPPSLSMVPGQGPSTLPNFGTGMKAPTAQQSSDASALYNQISPRLYQGSQLPALAPPTPYTNDPNLLKAGAGEKIGSWLGPALSVAGAFRNPLTQRETK